MKWQRQDAHGKKGEAAIIMACGYQRGLEQRGDYCSPSDSVGELVVLPLRGAGEVSGDSSASFDFSRFWNLPHDLVVGHMEH